MIKLSKTYTPVEFEDSIYEFWENNGYFKPETLVENGIIDNNAAPFCNTLPPPNLTGILHLGHTLTISLQDLMVRYHRMQGKKALFVPGTDHAGIATQNVVERELNKEGKDRKEIGREKFVEHVWDWKEKSHKIITKQSKKLGLSSDWDREAFTLSDQLSQAVREAFVTFFERDLIYRGNYLVNWCPGRCESAISDLEAEPKETQGTLWYIRYPLIDDNWEGPSDEWGSGKWAEGATQFIEVATTRPETLLGDTAVAIREDHPKYGKFLKKKAVIPAVGRVVEIISDKTVDPEFGTGAVKVTPAHDFNDYEMGLKHDLEFVNIFDDKAVLLEEEGGKYGGMDRFDARRALVGDLEKEGLLTKTEEYTHSLPFCQRCHTLIEPRDSLQWFVRTEPLATAVLEKLDNENINIIPDSQRERLRKWLDPDFIRDWCISRQLWWGHRIPVWYCRDCDELTVAREDPASCSNCNSTEIYQDEDVLDTWFSSALWPFSTLGWPDKTKDYEEFYPNQLRETGYDILFFWVAREMMMAVELTGQLPYENIYFHGLVRDEEGRKISKSMEDIDEYDPLTIIAKHGADTLRYTLVAYSTAGLDMNLDPTTIEATHKFGNKIWQMTRFILGNVPDDYKSVNLENIDLDKLELVDRWILSKFHELIKTVTEYYEKYNFIEAARELKRFSWNIFADWYIEISKIRIYDESNSKFDPIHILLYIIERFLRLLHPIMPFLTEKLWQVLPASIRDREALIISSWPEFSERFINKYVDEQFDIIIEVITAIRAIRGEYTVPPSRRIKAIISGGQWEGTLTTAQTELVELAKLEKETLEIHEEINPQGKYASSVANGVSVFIPVEGMIEIDEEVKRIDKEIQKLTQYIFNSESKLNSKFSERAPADIVTEEKERLENYKDQREKLEERKNMLLK